MDIINMVNEAVKKDISIAITNIINEAQGMLDDIGCNYTINWINNGATPVFDYLHKENDEIVKDYKKRMMENPVDDELDKAIQNKKEDRLLKASYYDEDFGAEVYVMDKDVL